MNQFASSLSAAIQNAIADDPHLHRVVQLQFQANITERVAEVKAETAKTQDVVREIGQNVTVQLQELNALLRQKPLSDSTAEFEIREKIYHARIEQARKLMEDGKPKTARRLLEELRSELSSSNPSKALRFRIATNIGGCAVQLDDQETAIKEIDLAFELEPENPMAITNASMATLLKGRAEDALALAERARALLPKNSVATANYIQALFALKREVELDELLKREDWIPNDANCCFAIGTLLFNRSRFSEAEKFFRSGLKAAPDEPRLLTHLAHAIVRPVQAALLHDPVLDWKYPPDTKPRLNEAEGLLDKAIVVQTDSEDRCFFAFTHVLRADVRRMLGKEAAAIADCEVAFHENPSDESPLPIKALAHLRAHQFDEAIATFERISGADTKLHFLIPWATACNAAKKPKKAVDLLKPYWEAEQHNNEQIGMADQLLWAYYQSGNTVEAEKVIATLQSVWPKNPDALAAIAHYRRQQVRTEEAIGLFSEALAYASGPRRDFLVLELASIFYARNEFSKAAELYASTADLTTDNELSRRYLVCLYNSGPHKEALTLAQDIRAGGEPLPVISQVEANILAEIGDLAGAQQIMERLCQVNPKLHAYKIAAAEFAMRRGRHINARQLLDQIPYDEVKTLANVLLRAAQLRAVLGMGDVLKYIYQARRTDFNSPKTHADYVWLFVSRESIDNAELKKNIIDEDCAVLLKIGNKRCAYVIISDSVLYQDRGEISPMKAHEMQLIGRKKNDQFLYDKDVFGNEINCEILEVQSKYVRAFQESLEKFPTLFPKDKTLQGIAGPYEKFREGLFRQLDEQQAAFRKIAAFYNAKQMTFEAFAGVLNCSPIELWGMLTGGRYCSLANFSGLLSDAEFEAKTASETKSIILDLTGILAFAQLGLLDRLPKRYQLFTTQPVLDAFAEAHAQAALSKPSMSVGKVGDNYIREVITAEQVVARKDFFERILQFLSENVTTLPIPSLLEKNEFLVNHSNLLGLISTASLLAAREKKLPLHSEDQMLRALGSNEWKIPGISAQPVLRELVFKGFVSKDERIEATARLFFMNFNVVLIGADNLMWTFRKLEYRLTDEAKKILTVFHGPNCTFESAVEVLAETTKRLWLDCEIDHLKLDLLNAILDALGTNRSTNEVTQYFIVTIKRKFLLAPNFAEPIVAIVKNWKERKLGQLGIIVSP